MLSDEEMLHDDKIAAIITYVRGAFGNTVSGGAVEQVKWSM